MYPVSFLEGYSMLCVSRYQTAKQTSREKVLSNFSNNGNRGKILCLDLSNQTTAGLRLNFNKLEWKIYIRKFRHLCLTEFTECSTTWVEVDERNQKFVTCTACSRVVQWTVSTTIGGGWDWFSAVRGKELLLLVIVFALSANWKK